MQRVIIIGGPGAGKSTLARTLARATCLAGWKNDTDAKARAAVEAAPAAVTPDILFLALARERGAAETPRP